jgi:hypothetical protein
MAPFYCIVGVVGDSVKANSGMAELHLIAFVGRFRMASEVDGARN